MSPSLYDLSADLKSLETLLEAEMEASGGDVSEGTRGAELQGLVEAYEWGSREKVDGYCSLIRNMEEDAAACAAEIERLQKRAGVYLNRIARVKALAKVSMELRGLAKVQGIKFGGLRIQQNGGKDPLELVEQDPKKYPDELVRVERRIDTEKVRTAILAGDTIAQTLARLGERGKSIRVF